jgi:branched-chain amino acid transport system permease protein
LERGGQLVIDGLVDGVLISVITIGFSAVYAVLRFPNFAIGAHAAIGAYAGYVANALLHWPIPAAFVVAFAVAGIAGALDDRYIVAPLRKTGALAAAIASIALAICIENVLRFFFGNGLRNYDVPVLRDVVIGPYHVGPQQLENALVALLVMAAASPTMGIDIILPIFAAAVVGGLGSIPGAVAGALAVGVAEGLSLLVVSPEYRGAVGFAAIVLMLTLRPRGLLGAREY